MPEPRAGGIAFVAFARPPLTLAAGGSLFQSGADEEGVSGLALSPFSPVPGALCAACAGPWPSPPALPLTLIGTGLPALAQGINILRDTETEEMLKSYETPLAKAAGLDPDATQGLAGGRSMT